MFAAFIAVIVLLHEMLLPFVAGMALAYLLDPMASRIERLGMNRLIATLTIVILFIVGVIAPIILAGPVIIRELAHFIDDLPLYVRQLRELATDENRPWLSTIVGDGLGQAERSFGELTSSRDRLDRRFFTVGMVGGSGVDLRLIAFDSDPDCRLLPHLRLEQHDSSSRPLDTTGATRHRHDPRPRGRRHNPQIYTWPRRAVYRPWVVLYGRPFADRTKARATDRARSGAY